MKSNKRKVGRPKMIEGKRTKLIRARLTEDEFKQIQALETSLGITRMELIRTRVLQHSNKVLVNATDLLNQLNILGAELGRSGNNINQLAKHANVLNKQGAMNDSILAEFNILFRYYITTQQNIEVVMRHIIRLMKS